MHYTSSHPVEQIRKVSNDGHGKHDVATRPGEGGHQLIGRRRRAGDVLTEPRRLRCIGQVHKSSVASETELRRRRNDSRGYPRRRSRVCWCLPGVIVYFVRELRSPQLGEGRDRARARWDEGAQSSGPKVTRHHCGGSVACSVPLCGTAAQLKGCECHKCLGCGSPPTRAGTRTSTEASIHGWSRLCVDES